MIDEALVTEQGEGNKFTWGLSWFDMWKCWYAKVLTWFHMHLDFKNRRDFIDYLIDYCITEDPGIFTFTPL